MYLQFYPILNFRPLQDHMLIHDVKPYTSMIYLGNFSPNTLIITSYDEGSFPPFKLVA